MKYYLSFAPKSLAGIFTLIVLISSCGVQTEGNANKKYAANEIPAEEVIQSPTTVQSDTLLIKTHLTYLTKTDKSRNHTNTDQLDTVAAYIFRYFTKYADTVYYQAYEVNEKIYRNVICSFGSENNKRIIVGAHYDVCGNQEGADDNASGVVGLLELARMLDGKTLNQRIDLVAYTLEEPPYFRTNNMGSYRHAKSLDQDKVNVSCMICLEMIGYFSDKKNSQAYPDPSMAAVYGTTGDYISIINKTSPGKFVDQFYSLFEGAKRIKTARISAPASVQGVDISDHLNYWKFGFSALMITDTAFFRNKNYHEASDQMETLNIQKMAAVIEAVCSALLGMSN